MTDPGVAARNGTDDLRRVHLFGLDFVDATSLDPVVAAVSSYESQTGDTLPLVVTPNVDHLVQLADADEVVVDATKRAAFVLPDGQPIVWASRWFGDRLSARLTGSDLFAAMFTHGGTPSAADVDEFLVIAPSQTVVDGLVERHPRLRAVVAPMIPTGDREAGGQFAADVVADLDDLVPKHIFICISQPKQLYLALDLISMWPADAPVALFYCVGASPEMYLGIEKRAPRWMQRLGLEFLFRAARSPGRLLKRYARDAARFPSLLLAERQARRARGNVSP
jgi:N-acetylglucosaminyldiphosphoundecaprenol N-acetyl-beta-D-mannosaminyltransferase